MGALISEKAEAAMAYQHERELCKNPDMSPYQTTGVEITAFMCGWDAGYQAALKSFRSTTNTE
jgi:hypothetical protein